MRGRSGILLLLIVLLSGCLREPPFAAPVVEPARVDPAPADETLRVTWTLDGSAEDALLTIRIDAPIRWPEPRCTTEDLMGRPAPGLPARSGGMAQSVPASQQGDHYECLHVVALDAGAVALTVTRPDADLERIRIFGPHVVPIDAARAQQRVPFGAFDLGETPDGLPLVTAELHPLLANASAPGAGPLFPAQSTHAALRMEIIPLGYTLTMSEPAAPTWSTPLHWSTTLDVPSRIQWAEGEFGEDYREDAYLLATFAHASNDVAFATSSAAVRGFGGCAEGTCFIRDG